MTAIYEERLWRLLRIRWQRAAELNETGVLMLDLCIRATALELLEIDREVKA